MASTLTLVWNDETAGGDPIAKVHAYCTKQVSPGTIVPPKSKFRLIKSAFQALESMDMTTPYVAKFGALIIGNKIFVRLVSISEKGIELDQGTYSIIVVEDS